MDHPSINLLRVNTQAWGIQADYVYNSQRRVKSFLDAIPHSFTVSLTKYHHHMRRSRLQHGPALQRPLVAVLFLLFSAITENAVFALKEQL